jgi:hypothetical protein
VAGFQAFLPKPLRFDRLLEVVGELLGLAWIATPTMAEALSPPSDDGTSEDPQARALLLETLYDLARRGDVRAIESRLAEFERVAPPDDELAARLRNLTQRYDMKGIRALLRLQGEPAA